MFYIISLLLTIIGFWVIDPPYGLTTEFWDVALLQKNWENLFKAISLLDESDHTQVFILYTLIIIINYLRL